MAMLDHYVKPYLAFSKTSDKVCLCGALAGEILALPDELRKRVEKFFEEHQVWLAEILARGLARKEFVFSAKPAKMARLVFGALQGALLVKRTTGDASQLKDVILVLKSQLSGRGEQRVLA
jgi:TetR/AcrR family transcriptional repressor of nem operon